MLKTTRRVKMTCATVIAATTLIAAPQAHAETVITPAGGGQGFASIISSLLGGNSAPVAPPRVAPDPEKTEEEELVVEVEKQIGTPYVWGGSQPGGFDCSGLTSWAYKQVGKSIPRTSQDQLSAGESVSFDALKPGDIIGYDNGGHVAMYVGDGDVIHAPQTGDVVKRVPLEAAGSNLYIAVRF